MCCFQAVTCFAPPTALSATMRSVRHGMPVGLLCAMPCIMCYTTMCAGDVSLSSAISDMKAANLAGDLLIVTGEVLGEV